MGLSKSTYECHRQASTNLPIKYTYNMHTCSCSYSYSYVHSVFVNKEDDIEISMPSAFEVFQILKKKKDIQMKKTNFTFQLQNPSCVSLADEKHPVALHPAHRTRSSEH